jgi:predicted nucleic acid-binding protein
VTLYFDTSALAKLVVNESESVALREWLAARTGTPMVTNTVGVVELQRLAAKVSQQASAAAVLLLGRIGTLQLTATAIALAAQLPPPEVRTLDALHVASAAGLGGLEALVSYDQRMIQAARGYGLPVASPR